MIKLDANIVNIIVKLSNKHSVSSNKVEKIIQAYYRGIKEKLASNENKPLVIKLDFLGKIIFDERAFNAAQRAREEARKKEELHNSLKPISLDEITNNR
jgi:hypothetical protein